SDQPIGSSAGSVADHPAGSEISNDVTAWLLGPGQTPPRAPQFETDTVTALPPTATELVSTRASNHRERVDAEATPPLSATNRTNAAAAAINAEIFRGWCDMSHSDARR
ncbi:MAG: hypothetical protein ABIR80_20980, partial [Opitutaceae bacterium]